MKYLIASDIHGCATAARLLSDRFHKGKCDKILLLGDLLYHGPRNALPQGYDTIETAKILNTLRDRIISVRGNCDAEVDQVMLEFSITSDHLLIPCADKLMFASHGHHYGPDNIPPTGSGDILLCGHTHIPGHRDVGGMLYCNPGSTSIPKGGSKPSFMTFDGEKMYWKELATGSVFDMLDLRSPE